MEFSPELLAMGQRAKDAARKLAYTSTDVKNQALLAMADALQAHKEEILEANKKDVEGAIARGTRKALVGRLTLTSEKIDGMSEALKEVVNLADPVGEGEFWTRPNGLRIQRTRVPLGVIAMIYEARPNVTVDAAALCLKSGNAVILRGGSEAIESNKVLSRIISQAAVSQGLPEGSIQLLENTDRQYAQQLMKMNGYVDAIIPRGGAGLIQTVVKESTVPVIETGAGLCHGYVDKDANLTKGVSIIFNAKTQNPGVCNAIETLLVHEAIAEKYLPMIASKFNDYGVEMRGCERTCTILPTISQATPEDWGEEYLDLIISIKVVKDVDEAMDHIYQYGTKHSETIVTENYTTAQRFLNEVDAAAVYVNASTRYTDGGRFGFGAEIGISTQKLHARGPMGLEALTTMKYMVYGDDQIVT